MGRANIPSEVVVIEQGKDVGEEIVQAAREQRVDLIVMLSRRSHPALLGSTAEQVSRAAFCPVLIVNTREREDAARAKKQGEVRQVLGCHDFSSGAELALSYALSVAQKFKADLDVIHVL